MKNTKDNSSPEHTDQPTASKTESVPYTVPEQWTSDEIVRLRKLLNINRQQLAEHCGASPSTVCHWEKDFHGISGRFIHRLNLIAAELETYLKNQTVKEWTSNRVARLRAATGWTLDKFARRINVAISTVYNWENEILQVADKYVPALDALQREKGITEEQLGPVHERNRRPGRRGKAK